MITVRFASSGRGKAQCPPDPAYPNGIALPSPLPDAPNCAVELPYPAPECGYWLVECDTCQQTVMITAAGRPDDPISASIPCHVRRRA